LDHELGEDVTMLAAIHWHTVFFLLLAVAACAAAVAVVLSANIVRMAVYLVASLSAVSGLFFLAGADFLGAVQLMVYVGGTLVLLVFGVMLTARGPLVALRTNLRQWVLALLIGGALGAVLLQTVWSVGVWNGRDLDVRRAEAEMKATPPTAAPLGLALMGIRPDRLDAAAAGPDRSAGMVGYLLAFEIISVHLLVVLIGAAYLARAKRDLREVAAEERAAPFPPNPGP
jgi:NADH:ubiquinone oxidoreductase subunit 6 (subunit J)